MIKALEIENFKGIGERQRIEFAPITLLFGPNSAGKSTVIQALAYFFQILKEGNVDVDVTDISGDKCKLGGFENILHRQDSANEVSLKLELSDGKTLPFIRGCPDDRFGVIDRIRGAQIGVEISIQDLKNTFFTISLDGIEAGRLRFYGDDFCGPEGTVFLDFLNLYHPCFLAEQNSLEECVDRMNRRQNRETELQVSLRPTSNGGRSEVLVGGQSVARNPGLALDELVELSNIWDLFADVNTVLIPGEEKNIGVRPDGEVFGVALRTSSFARGFGRGKVPVPLVYRRLEFPDEAFDPFLGTTVTYDDPFADDPSMVSEEWQDLVSVLSYLFVAVTAAVRRELDILYLGPIRAIPSKPDSIWRTGITRKLPAGTSGAQAWQSLFFLNPRPLHRVNAWLNSPDLLDLGIEIQKKEYLLVDEASRLGLNLNFPLYFPESGGLEISPDEVGIKRQWGFKELGELGKTLTEQKEVRLIDTRSGLEVFPEDVGVGVSQILPIVIWGAGHWDTGQPILCVEQPELHLHPKAQLALGDFFIGTKSIKNDESEAEDEGAEERSSTSMEVRAAKQLLDTVWDPEDAFEGYTWLIETHSEHILLRFLRRVRETCAGDVEPAEFALRPEDLAVNYVEMGDTGVQARRLHVNEDGDFDGNWPEGFFEERNEELF